MSQIQIKLTYFLVCNSIKCSVYIEPTANRWSDRSWPSNNSSCPIGCHLTLWPLYLSFQPLEPRLKSPVDSRGIKELPARFSNNDVLNVILENITHFDKTLYLSVRDSVNIQRESRLNGSLYITVENATHYAKTIYLFVSYFLGFQKKGN